MTVIETMEMTTTEMMAMIGVMVIMMKMTQTIKVMGA